MQDKQWNLKKIPKRSSELQEGELRRLACWAKRENPINAKQAKKQGENMERFAFSGTSPLSSLSFSLLSALLCCFFWIQCGSVRDASWSFLFCLVDSIIFSSSPLFFSALCAFLTLRMVDRSLIFATYNQNHVSSPETFSSLVLSCLVSLFFILFLLCEWQGCHASHRDSE